MRPVGSDGKTVTEDMYQMVVKDQCNKGRGISTDDDGKARGVHPL